MARTVRRFAMLQPGERVLIGLSGGPDSSALTHALALLSERLSLRLEALYVDHGIRGAAVEADLAAASALASTLGVGFHVRRVEVPTWARLRRLSLETAARELRYRALEEAAGELGAQKVALGHTADDQAETVLMWVLRGAGVAGLGGIPPVRGRFVRPLIEVWREEVQEYCHQAGLAPVEDESNRWELPLRNRVRHELLPLIESRIRPGARRALVRLASLAREDEAYLRGQAQEAWRRLAATKQGGRLAVPARPLGALPAPLARRIVVRAFEEVSGGRRGALGLQAVEAVLELARRGHGGRVVHLPHGVRAGVSEGWLWMAAAAGRPRDGDG